MEVGMDTPRSYRTEIKARRQVTIPKNIRMSHLEEGQTVSFIPGGDSIIITPDDLHWIMRGERSEGSSGRLG